MRSSLGSYFLAGDMWFDILTLSLATALPRLRIWCTGGFEMGVMLSFVFFASIAAGADIAAMLRVAPLLVLFVLILLATHLSCSTGRRPLAETHATRAIDRLQRGRARCHYCTCNGGSKRMA